MAEFLTSGSFLLRRAAGRSPVHEGQAGVDCDQLPGDVRRVRRAEKRHDARDFLGRSSAAAKRDGLKAQCDAYAVPNGPRGDAIHADGPGRELEGQLFHEDLQRRLRHRVCGVAHGFVLMHGSDKDDCSAARHGVYESLREEKGPAQVGPKHPVEGLGGGAAEGARDADAGGVDQRGERTEALSDPAGHVAVLPDVANVVHDGQEWPMACLRPPRKPLQPLRIHVYAGNGVAVVGKLFGDGFADAMRSAGDDGDWPARVGYPWHAFQCSRHPAVYARSAMTIGLLGLGKMGLAFARKLTDAQHQVIGADPDPAAAEAGLAVCTAVADTHRSLAARLERPRLLWLLVPPAAVDAALEPVLPALESGDIIVDGGNSRFQDSQRRALELTARGFRFVDVGVSGGPRGGGVGFSLMVGGDADAVEVLRPILQTLSLPSGAWGHVGASGAGHFVKMVHNGIEYGMMEALAEGVDVLAHGPVPHLNLADVARVWRGGSVIRSFLVDLLADILSTERLETVAGRVGATGEGEWTVETARAHGVDVPAITAAVSRRKESQQRDLYAAKILALFRSRFGGHSVERRLEG